MTRHVRKVSFASGSAAQCMQNDGLDGAVIANRAMDLPSASQPSIPFSNLVAGALRRGSDGLAIFDLFNLAERQDREALKKGFAKGGFAEEMPSVIHLRRQASTWVASRGRHQ